MVADMEVLEKGMVALEGTAGLVMDSAKDTAGLVTDAGSDIVAAVKTVNFVVMVEDGQRVGRSSHSFEAKVGLEAPAHY